MTKKIITYQKLNVGNVLFSIDSSGQEIDVGTLLKPSQKDQLKHLVERNALELGQACYDFKEYKNLNEFIADCLELDDARRDLFLSLIHYAEIIEFDKDFEIIGV